MANAGKNMNGSQFFITTCAASHLNGHSVAFGRVLSGMEVVRQIERCPISREDVPLGSVLIDDCGCDCGVIPHVAVPLSQHPPTEAQLEQRAMLREREERRKREAQEIEEEDEGVVIEEIEKMVKERDEKWAAQREAQQTEEAGPKPTEPEEEDDSDDDGVVIEEQP